MSVLTLSVIGLVILALLFDFTNGFHDAANSVATVVATRALPARWAPLFSAFFNFAAYFVVGLAVANTVSKVVDSASTGVAVIFAALIGAIVWNYVTWFIGMPSSSSHAMVGGLVGAGLAAGGISAIDWSSVDKVVAAIVASPVVAFTVAVVAMVVIAVIQRMTRVRDDHVAFKGLQVISAAAVSFGHGANDSQKTMGVIAALLLGTGTAGATVNAHGEIQLSEWIPIAAYTAIALGTWYGGWKIIETMGLRITTLHANSGLAANIGAVAAIFGATAQGIPISTTHAAAASVAGAGVSSGRGLNMRVLGQMVVAWVVTMPAAGAVAFVLYKMTQLPTGLAWISVCCLLFVVGGFVVYAMTHSIGVKDVEAELQSDEQLEEHVPARPRLEGESPLH